MPSRNVWFNEENFNKVLKQQRKSYCRKTFSSLINEAVAAIRW